MTANLGELLDKNVEREILNHRRLVHPNVLAFREVFATDEELAIVVRAHTCACPSLLCHQPLPACITAGQEGCRMPLQPPATPPCNTAYVPQNRWSCNAFDLYKKCRGAWHAGQLPL